MKILVTGGAGFIGSHIADRYIAGGHSVVIVDNLSTGRREFINPAAVFYEADIRGRALEDIFAKERPDIVNHHAAQIDIRKSVSDPAYDASVNIIGSLNVIQNSIKAGVKKIIFASSGGAVYGVPEYMPVPETHRTLPISPYGAAKLAVENYLFVMDQSAGINYTILRYGNVYGPRQNPMGEAGVCSIFLGRMRENKPCTLYGMGHPVRDYVYVEDVAEANLSALSGGDRNIYNIGTGIGSTVKDIYGILKDLTGYGIAPVYKDLRPGELEEISLDCLKAERELGFRPQILLKDGLLSLAKS